MEVIKFGGYTHENVISFLAEFEAISSVNKLDDSQKKHAIKLHLYGPALIYYNSIVSSCNLYIDLCTKLKEEFLLEINYIKIFYEAKMSKEDDILNYLYSLMQMADKAGISNEQIFVTRFIESVLPNIRYRIELLNIMDINSLKKIVKTISAAGNVKKNVPNCNFPNSQNMASRDMTEIPQGNRSFNSSRIQSPRVQQGNLSFDTSQRDQSQSVTVPLGTPRNSYHLRPRPHQTNPNTAVNNIYFRNKYTKRPNNPNYKDVHNQRRHQNF